MLDLAPHSPGYANDEFGQVPFLEAVGVFDEGDGSLSIFAVNRDLEDPLPLCGDLRDFAGYRVAEHWVLRHDDLKASNTLERPDVVAPAPAVSPAAAADGVLEAQLAPASWNLIRLRSETP